MRLNKERIAFFVGIITILIGIMIASWSMGQAITIQYQRTTFLEEENIDMERISVVSDEGINIEGLIYVDEDLKSRQDHSVPTILLLHGMNNRKETGFDKVYQLVKLGYAVVSVEERGHGESGGISALLGKEPYDMMNVLDHVEQNCAYSDSDRFALYAFSYGGGVATILQALDDRVHASVIYHPLSTIDGLSEEVPFQNLLGSTLSIPDLNAIKDGYETCTPENTKNLLLIQGDQDNVIKPEHSQGLYELIDGENRDDIDLIIRPGLGHGPNEADDDSFRYTIAWFEHYYHDPSIDITNLDEEIKNIEFSENNYPDGTTGPEDQAWWASIILFIGLFILFYPTWIWERSSKHFQLNPFKIEITSEESYKKMILKRTVVYLGSYAIGAVLFAIFNPSIIIGYCMIIPVIVSVILLLIPNSEYSSWRAEWKDWKEKQLQVSALSLLVVITPILFFIVFSNINASLMISYPIPFFTITLVSYSLIALGMLFSDLLLIRGWKFKHGLLILGIRPLSFLIFFLLNPMAPFMMLGEPLASGIYLLIFALVGIVFWILILVIHVVNIGIRNKLSSALLLFLPVIVFLLDRFFRII